MQTLPHAKLELSPVRTLAGRCSSCMGRLLLGLIAFYQQAISPYLGANCRFYPSCSVYAAASIRAFGPWRGLWRALARLLRCNPFHPGGYDPPEGNHHKSDN